jgi:uncharacterized protein (TIGR02391 family)
MARRPTPPDASAPTIAKQQGQNALRAMKEKGETLLAQRPVQEAAFDTWVDSTISFISKTFGSQSNHISNFIGQIQIQVVGYGWEPDERHEETKRAQELKRRIDVITSLIEQLGTELALEGPPAVSPAAPEDAIWPVLHAKVLATAKARFDDGHYADCVEATLKELNTVIKEMVRKKTGQELDGAALMQKAFSPNPPVVIALDDLSTESGKNIQQGYMQIFAGAMVGIRNPKAHANITITKERCIHFLFLASLLFNKLDERP